MDVGVGSLGDFLRDLNSARRRIETLVGREFKDVGSEVALRARELAEARGLRDTGKMIRSINVASLPLRAVISVTATRRGFAYPMLYRGQFLDPAARESGTKLERALERGVDRALSESNL